MAGYFPCRFTTSSNQHEQFLEVILRRVLEKRPGTFIDVGVNAGQTLAKVLSIDKERLYLGFEPQLSCCFNADQFIKANELVNARILPIALRDNNHLLSFFPMVKLTSAPAWSIVEILSTTERRPLCNAE